MKKAVNVFVSNVIPVTIIALLAFQSGANLHRPFTLVISLIMMVLWSAVLALGIRLELITAESDGYWAGMKAATETFERSLARPKKPLVAKAPRKRVAKNK